MSLRSVTCPTCGEQSTEHAGNTWQCLFCRNKFVYEPPKAPETKVSTSISMHTDALYDIETGGPPNTKPVLRTPPVSPRDDALYQALAKDSETKSNRLYNAGVTVVGCVLASALFWFVNAVNRDALSERAGRIIYMAFVAGAALSVVAFVKFLRDVRRLRTQLSVREQYLAATPGPVVQMGTIVLCPYCHEDYENFLFDHGQRRELTHCKKCGRQFLLDGLNSYRIRRQGLR